MTGRGVCAYAADAVFELGSCFACAQLDLVAIAHTWLAIAHGRGAGTGCLPSWVAAEATAKAARRRRMGVMAKRAKLAGGR